MVLLTKYRPLVLDIIQKMVEYNKIYKKKDGRVLVANGPREAQRRQQANAITHNELESIREELDSLRAKLNTTSIASEVSTTQFDTIIEETTLEIEQQYVKRISELETTLEERNKYIAKLEDRLDKQDMLLSKLTNNIGVIQATAGTAPVVVDEAISRPTIDSVFIDPTVKGAEDKLKSYVKSEEVKSSKTNTSASIDKLKNLMGSKLLK